MEIWLGQNFYLLGHFWTFLQNISPCQKDTDDKKEDLVYNHDNLEIKDKNLINTDAKQVNSINNENNDKVSDAPLGGTVEYEIYNYEIWKEILAPYVSI